MNPKFVEANRRVFARTVETELKKELAELQAVLEGANFEHEFYFPDSLLVKGLKKFDGFFNRVVIKGWGKANTALKTANAVEALYDHLEDEAVAVPEAALAEAGTTAETG